MQKRLSTKAIPLFIAALAATLLFAHSVQSATLEVGSGKPHTTIQAAINDAGTGDTVLVYEGTYTETINFLGKAITVESVNGAAVTTIDGNASGAVVKFESGEGVDSVIDGFTITNGFSIVGAGIYCAQSSPTIINCIISENEAFVAGGGLFCGESFSTITNCIIFGNHAGNAGGAVVFGGVSEEFPSITITNCTISGNIAEDGIGSGIYGAGNHGSATIINSILWGNTGDNNEIYLLGSAHFVTVLYSDVNQDGYGLPDGSADTNGNIRKDPLWVDPLNKDFHLQAGSPCIDTGTSVGAPTYDIEGTIRPQGSGYDMGAYEYKEDKIIIAVDFKPGSCPNPIGFADNKGLMPFAIMGNTGFDITQIDPASIRISRDGVADEVKPIKWNYNDVATPFEGELCDCHELMVDGYMDLSMNVYRKDLVEILRLQEVAGQTLSLIVTGKLKDEFGGTPIKGQDCVRVLKTVLIK